MTSVTFPPEVGGDGSTVSDDENPNTGLRKGGYTTRFVAALVQMVAIAQVGVTKAQEAAASALSALNAPATNATSATSLSLTDSGSITLTLAEVGKAFTVGMTIGIARTSDPLKQMIGVITAFNSNTGAMTVAMQSKSETAGPFSDWTIFRTATGGVPATRAVGVTGGLLTGGGTLAADFSIGLPKLTATEVAAGTKDDAVMTAKNFADAGKPQALTYAANIAWPIQRRKARVVLTGNGAVQEPTGAVEGAFYSLEIAQDATGGWLASFASCFEFEDGETPDMPSAPNAVLRLYMECIATSPTLRMFVRSAQ